MIGHYFLLQVMYKLILQRQAVESKTDTHLETCWDSLPRNIQELYIIESCYQESLIKDIQQYLYQAINPDYGKRSTTSELLQLTIKLMEKYYNAVN